MHSQDENLMVLGCMFLANILRAEFKFQNCKCILKPEVVMTLKVVVERWARGEKSRGIFQQVAKKLWVLLEID